MNSESERDRSVERLLRRSLGSSASEQSSGPCLDAEALAAWIDDGGLSGEERAAAQAHLAGCSRCQALVASIVRTEPEAQPAESWWHGWLRARWLVPVAATAAAIAIWVAVPREQFSRPPGQSSEEEASAAQQPAAPAQMAGASADARASAALADRQTPGAPDAAAAREANQQASALKSDVVPAEATPTVEVQGQRDESPAALGRTDVVGEPSFAGRAAGAAAAAPAELRVAEAAQDARAPAPASAPAPVAQTENARERAADARSPVPDPRSPGLESRAPSPESRAPIAVLSPDPSSRWRIGAAGAVEYSANGGATWDSTPSGTTADLTAGASPSRTVCWIVGRAGTVLLTTDGRRWQRVSFPVTADLIGVQATDARSATVQTADGRRFATADAGASWR